MNVITIRGPAVVVEPSRPTVIHPSEPVIVRPASTVVVDAPQRAVWDERGWTRKDDGNSVVYEGWFQVAERATGQRQKFEGRIVDRGRRITAYIADPPPQLRQHPKAPCFTRTTGPWFQLHWYRAARNVDDSLLYIERVLDESINDTK